MSERTPFGPYLASLLFNGMILFGWPWGCWINDAKKKIQVIFIEPKCNYMFFHHIKLDASFLFSIPNKLSWLKKYNGILSLKLLVQNSIPKLDNLHVYDPLR